MCNSLNLANQVTNTGALLLAQNDSLFDVTQFAQELVCKRPKYSGKMEHRVYRGKSMPISLFGTRTYIRGVPRAGAERSGAQGGRGESARQLQARRGPDGVSFSFEFRFSRSVGGCPLLGGGD